VKPKSFFGVALKAAANCIQPRGAMHLVRKALDEGVMERLDEETLAEFLQRGPVAVVLFGAPSGRPTLEQAEQFALLWADHPDSACFGYLDALENEAARKSFDIRILPTSLVFRDGVMAARFEGYRTRGAIEAALKGLGEEAFAAAA
jgi:thioredoxin-like negative regulator of GroEL